MKKILFIYLLTLTITPATHKADAKGIPDENELKIMTFEASYVGDNVNNLSGGVRTGSCYLGMANLKLIFNMEQARLWKGGQIYLNTANTHGATPSSDLLGDLQVVSNIEAGNHTYLQEIWYKQTLGTLEITVGLQDLNVEFANSEHGALYLNSSFGILPVISGNFAAPIFPLTTLGLTTRWDIFENVSWVNAVYDGSPTDFDYNPYNIKWQFNSGDGLLLISEIQKSVSINTMSGVYKIGVYHHFHRERSDDGTVVQDSLKNKLVGIYSHIDQKIWEQGHKNIGFFTQIGYSPSETCANRFYFGSGINCSGLITKKNDTMGFAVAHCSFTHRKKNETTFEFTWQCPINENVFIQPDIQYIFHPAGTNKVLNNAFACNLRFGFNF